MTIVLWFAASLEIEKVHPLQGGLFRLKHRKERRPGLPPVSALAFYPRLIWDLVRTNTRLAVEGLKMYRLCRRIAADPNSRAYTDLAMSPVREDETENLELFTQHGAARDAVEHARKVKTLIGASSKGAPAPVPAAAG